MLVALALIWGASFMFIKVAVRELSPATLIMGRLGLAALTLAILVPWTRETVTEIRENAGWLVAVALALVPQDAADAVRDHRRQEPLPLRARFLRVVAHQLGQLGVGLEGGRAHEVLAHLAADRVVHDADSDLALLVQATAKWNATAENAGAVFGPHTCQEPPTRR